MADFMIRFFICNVPISIAAGILLLTKHLFKNHLTSRMQYHLWFPLLGILAVPFLPVRPAGFAKILSWFDSLKSPSASHTEMMLGEPISQNLARNTNWINDFTISVSRGISPVIGLVFCWIWLAGIVAMVLFVIKSVLRLQSLKKSALPLQNQEVHRLYNQCLAQMRIKRKIPIYSTAYIKSPFTVGIAMPRIYLPIHLISDYNETDCRFMLLHELQHYKHGDALINSLMNVTCIIYWFNPMIWYAIKEMRNDREIACDSSVLSMLEEQDYRKYGNTLINFAEKLSFNAFPFVSNMGGKKKQIEKRILNISSYQPATKLQKIKGVCSCFLIACLLFSFIPLVSVNAVGEDNYQLNEKDNLISYIDLSSYFDRYEGCFVLFDTSAETWQIYNETMAQRRISPNSTYKIYSALLGLENGYITPASNDMAWNGQEYPIAEWNADQNLTTALQNSVNWYFQLLDQAAGLEVLEDFYTNINYGSHDLSGGISSFWTESSLKISPVEQVELLRQFYINEFRFDADNVYAVKNALLLASNADGNLYGKTGTGNINGKNVNGWFIGFVETSNNTYFFALNISADDDAAGSQASNIVLSILSDLAIWQ